jgi:hypothetical protein
MHVLIHCLHCLQETRENPREDARLEVELEFETGADVGVLHLRCVRCNRSIRSFSTVVPSEIRDLPNMAANPSDGQDEEDEGKLKKYLN